MNRELQRTIGALKTITDRSRGIGFSTLRDTSHCSADTIDYLISAGGGQFKDYDAKTRRRMATEGRALPDGSFPIADCGDAEDAIRSIGRASKEKRTQAEAHIRKRVRSLGCSGSIFDGWK